MCMGLQDVIQYTTTGQSRFQIARSPSSEDIFMPLKPTQSIPHVLPLFDFLNAICSSVIFNDESAILPFGQYINVFALQLYME